MSDLLAPTAYLKRLLILHVLSYGAASGRGVSITVGQRTRNAEFFYPGEVYRLLRGLVEAGIVRMVAPEERTRISVLYYLTSEGRHLLLEERALLAAALDLNS